MVRREALWAGKVLASAEITSTIASHAKSLVMEKA
jgi:hypothetical protein